MQLQMVLYINKENNTKKAEELEKLGPVVFYVKKYLPYIVGAIALAILIPAVRKR